ncbi:MAG: tRNA glutamyl-Q(34) synthetase GluQRS [Thermoanaerobaculia bacterium]
MAPTTARTPETVGRFAPSPTGPLHLGGLVAAVGSFLFARASRGRWLLRMEDLDRPRVVPGAADDIARSLERHGLHWDGEVVWQSQRQELYTAALERLRAQGLTYPCACSRRELLQAASAPALDDANEEDGSARIYPGTCRDGLPSGRRARAIRFRVEPCELTFEDEVRGVVTENTSEAVGDFVVQRADGVAAYQLGVVVDDAAQGVTQVVRGADLLSSTARQIHLQRALSLAKPCYAHLPLVLAPDGSKLGKRDGALPLNVLSEASVRATLGQALEILGQPFSAGSPAEMLASAVEGFDPGAIPAGPVKPR